MAFDHLKFLDIAGSMLTNTEDEEKSTIVAVKVPKLKSFTPGTVYILGQ
jgi:hypothetical protein